MEDNFPELTEEQKIILDNSKIVELDENNYPAVYNGTYDDETLEPIDENQAIEPVDPKNIPSHSQRRKILKQQGLLKVKDSDWFQRVQMTQATGHMIADIRRQEMIQRLEAQENLRLEGRKKFLVENFGQERGLIEYQKEIDRKNKRLEKKLHIKK